jgi:hypothetical protein
MKGMGKISRGSGFRGALSYALENERGKVIGGNMSGHTIDELSAQFGVTINLRPDIEKSVWHNCLRAPKGEKLTLEQWFRLGDDYMAQMGFKDDHLRTYVLHDDEDGQHIHIIASRVSLSGEIFYGKQENLESTRIIQELEITHGLQITKGREYQEDGKIQMPGFKRLTKNEIEEGLRTGIEPARQRLAKYINEALADGEVVSVQQFAERLAVAGVHVLPAMAKATDKLNGLSFVIDGKAIKGSDIGDDFGFGKLQKRGLIYEQGTDGPAVRQLIQRATSHKDHERVTGNDPAAQAGSTTGRTREQTRTDSPSVGDTVRRDAGDHGSAATSTETGGQGNKGRTGTVAVSDEGSHGRSTSNPAPAEQKRIEVDSSIDSIVNSIVGSYGRIADLAAPVASGKQQDELAGNRRDDYPAPKPTDRADRAPTADEIAKIKSWRQQSGALDAPAYRITLKDREIPQGRDRTYNPGKDRETGQERFWTAVEVEAMIPRLRRENARKFDIYITPIDPAHHYIVVDDSTLEKVAAMRAEGFMLCLTQQSSAGNVQAIVKAKRVIERKDEQKIANKLVVQLNEPYGDPRFSGVIHAFRMAGFSNKKPGKGNAFTVVLSAFKGVCAHASTLLAGMREKADMEALERENARKQALADKAPTTRRHDVDLAAPQDGLYGQTFMDVARRAAAAGFVVDASRCDFQACKELLLTYSTQDVEQMLLIESPGLHERHADTQDYARRTVEAALERLSHHQHQVNDDHEHGR